MHDDLPSAVPAPEPDARPVPVLYTFTCGGAKVPCKLTYTYESDLHNQRYIVLAGGTERGAAVGGTQGSFFGGTTATRNMLISCKD